MRWYEMSYYKIEKEQNENMSDKLRKENKPCYSVQEWQDLKYRTFNEDKYDEESEA